MLLNSFLKFKLVYTQNSKIATLEINCAQQKKKQIENSSNLK